MPWTVEELVRDDLAHGRDLIKRKPMIERNSCEQEEVSDEYLIRAQRSFDKFRGENCPPDCIINCALCPTFKEYILPEQKLKAPAMMQ